MAEITDFEVAKASLLKLIENAIQKKPQSKEEALELFHSLQVAIGPWLVSELPALEQKSVLVGLWAVNQLETNCFSFLKR